MQTSHVSRKNYKGLERRSSMERRLGVDRRNLVRFESLGSDRRAGVFRRREEMYWEKAFDTKID